MKISKYPYMQTNRKIEMQTSKYPDIQTSRYIYNEKCDYLDNYLIKLVS